ncbi:MAG: nitrate/nitrite transporter NrtS [Leptolyngbyaceae cyanobacterium]
MGQGLLGYISALRNPTLAVNSVRVALVVGSILFVINHGGAAMENRMSRTRWISALLTYCVPYSVSIHGQYVAARSRS